MTACTQDTRQKGSILPVIKGISSVVAMSANYKLTEGIDCYSEFASSVKISLVWVSHLTILIKGVYDMLIITILILLWVIGVTVAVSTIWRA